MDGKLRRVIIDNIKNLLFGIIVVLLLLTVCITVDYADETITADNLTAKQVCEKFNRSDVIIVDDTQDAGVAKLQKVVTEKPKIPIIGMYAKPSCGCRYRYTWHYREFVNYCPNCGHYGTLRKNPKGVPEKEYTCHTCSSDFCGCCGKEKYSWSRVYLKKG